MIDRRRPEIGIDRKGVSDRIVKGSVLAIDNKGRTEMSDVRGREDSS